MMSDDEITMSLSIPLDDDGYLRRECPTCEREFKVLPDQSDDDVDDEARNADVDPEGYFCPYCAVQAATDAWHTTAQLEQAEAVVLRQVMGPALKDFQRSIKGLNRSGLVRASVDYDLPDEPEPMAEDVSMRRVDFGCHPDEPLKVLEDWSRPVHCLICGTRA
jgi:hypothetical protein